MFESYIQSVINDPLIVIAPVAALVVSYVFFYEGLLYNIGNDSGFWKRVRSWLPMVDDEARDMGFYTSYGVGGEELVGKLAMDVETARKLFLDL